MDGEQFDYLTLRCTMLLGRRRLGALLTGLGLAAALGVPAASAPKGRKHKKPKKSRKKCKRGKKKCGKKCVNTRTNPTHCGGCNRPCGAGVACQDGVCSEACESPNTDCSGVCVDTQTSNAHCGDCDNACQGYLTCLAGSCGCAAGTACGDQCVDTQTDNDYCGNCETTCAQGTTCHGGQCEPPLATCGSGGECRVFATSATYNGDLGGLTGADEKCNARAQAAGLPGSYKAWLSDGTGSPSSRFVQSTGPYVLVTGAAIADDWDDLTDDDVSNDELDHVIDRDEFGNEIPGDPLYRYVWTNTAPDGTLYSDLIHCLDWSTSERFVSLGGVGNVYYADSYWTNATSLYCDERLRLFCFQQS